MRTLTPGLRVGEHVLVRRAGAGAMSEVYEARHATSGQPAALKALRADRCLDMELVARFLNEARALSLLQHEHVVRVLDCGLLPEGPPYMLLEWLPLDLHQALVRAGGRLAPPAAARVILQLAKALEALHARGIVHRDLKPSNVLVANEDLSAPEVKLADLGLAKVPAQGQDSGSGEQAQLLPVLPVSTGGAALLGTWDYMAPEQWIQSKRVEPKTDVYALGVLWFQMLAGRLPFVAGQQENLMCLHLFERPPLELLEGLVPPGSRELLGRMLEKEVPRRLTLHELVEGLGTAAPSKGPPPPPSAL